MRLLSKLAETVLFFRLVSGKLVALSNFLGVYMKDRP